MDEKFSMEEVMDSLPKNTVLLKGDSKEYKYDIRKATRMYEVLKHYIPTINISNDYFSAMVNRNLKGYSKRSIPEFNLSDKEVLSIGEKRIAHFMKNREGFVFENPKIYRMGNLNVGYCLTYNENSVSQEKPATEFNFLPFQASLKIDGHKNIPEDDVIISYMANCLGNNYGEIYPILYSMYYVNQFFNYRFLKGEKEVKIGHINGLGRKLKLIGKEIPNPVPAIKRGLYIFDYKKLQDVPPKDYENE